MTLLLSKMNLSIRKIVGRHPMIAQQLEYFGPTVRQILHLILFRVPLKLKTPRIKPHFLE